MELRNNPFSANSCCTEVSSGTGSTLTTVMFFQRGSGRSSMMYWYTLASRWLRTYSIAATGIPASGTPTSVVPIGVVLPNTFSTKKPEDSKNVLIVSRVNNRRCVRSSSPVSEYLNTPASRESRTSP